MDKPTKDLQAVIIEMMRQTDLKPAQLATKAGVAASTLTRYVSAEGEIKNPDWAISSSTLSKLCAATGVTVIFTKDGIFVGPKRDSYFAKDDEEVRWLKGWRALDPGERDALKRQLRGLLATEQLDNVI